MDRAFGIFSFKIGRPLNYFNTFLYLLCEIFTWIVIGSERWASWLTTTRYGPWVLLLVDNISIRNFCFTFFLTGSFNVLGILNNFKLNQNGIQKQKPTSYSFSKTSIEQSWTWVIESLGALHIIESTAYYRDWRKQL